jgi:hypothetical protein
MSFREQMAQVHARRQEEFERRKQRQEFEQKCKAENERREYEAFMLHVYNTQRTMHPKMSDAEFRAFEIAQHRAGAPDPYADAWDAHKRQERKRPLEEVHDDKFVDDGGGMIWLTGPLAKQNSRPKYPWRGFDD